MRPVLMLSIVAKPGNAKRIIGNQALAAAAKTDSGNMRSWNVRNLGLMSVRSQVKSRPLHNLISQGCFRAWTDIPNILD